MNLTIRSFAAALALTACSTFWAQSGLNNPITQAVLGVYEEQLRENPKDYGVLLSRADEYYRHNDYVRALPDVDKALEYAPKSDEEAILRGLILRAGIYNETKRPEKAIEDLRQAAQLAPDSYSIVYQKANTEYVLGLYPEARADYQLLVRLNPRGSEGYIGQARVAVKENNLGTANEMLEKAVGIDPNNAELYVRRSSVRKQMGDHNGAVDDLLLALSADSRHPRAMQELIDYGNTNYPATMAGLSSAISQAPQVGMYRYIRAVIAQAHFHYLAALNDYQAILDQELYNYHGIYGSIAECQFALGEYADALNNIDHALGMVKDVARYYVLQSQILRAMDRNEDAVKAAAAGLAVDRQSVDALCEMALAYRGIGNYQEASNLLGEAILTDADAPMPYMLRAQLLAQNLNKESAAAQLYEKVTEMDHFYLENPRSLKGFALLFLGKTDQAKAWIKNVLNSNTDYDGLIHYYAACLYAQAGELDKAMDCTRTALELGYANYYNWTEADDGGVNVGELRNDLNFLNLLHRYNSIFGKK
ncbi:MAG: tetratricopeptide repeat protein [Bacteroidales bacterium]|nr:tetratricopeptide repeat protein [Bacteroidales bacterium]